MTRSALRSLRLLTASALAALAATGGVASVQAQGALDDTTAWERLGAVRQSTRALGFSGDPDEPTLWGGGAGLYRLDSLDGLWVRISLFISDDPILFLGNPFDAAGPDTVFAGRLLYRSLDGGATFTRLETPAGGDDTVIGSDGALDRFPLDSPYPLRLVSGDGPSVVYSDDGGDSWTRAEASPRHEPFRLHTFRSGRVLSVGFFGAALSRDGGRTFAHVPALYDTARVSFDLTELVVLDGFVTGRPGDSEEGRVLVLGTQAGRPGTQVWASDDEGDTWRQVHQFEWGGTWDAAAPVLEAEAGAPGWAVAAEEPGRVFATVDGGETWVRIGVVPGVGENADGGTTRVQAVDVGPDGRLYAGTSRSGSKESWSYRSRARVAEVIQLATAGSPVSVGGEGRGLGLSVSPNPTGGAATVVLRLAGPARVRVSVVDAVGREVNVAFEGPAADGQRISLETAGLAPGVYRVVAVTARGETTSVPLTVVQ